VSKKNTKKQSLTDWKKVDEMTDDDIDFSDIPELDDNFFKNAKFSLAHEGQVGEKNTGHYSIADSYFDQNCAAKEEIQPP